ncbi:MAG: DUF917 domain-containing protein [Thermomicrobiales bacterium]
MRTITIDQLDDMAMGAAVLGTGGGGNPYIGKLMARSAMRGKPPVQMLSFDDLDDDDLIAPTAMMGAPTVMVEKVPSGEEIVSAFLALQELYGRPFRATMSIEAGGVNSLVPLTVAARLGIPLVDGDSMGRAFPEIQMVTATLVGVKATPMALADDKGNSVIFNTIDNRWTETFARSVTVDMGAAAYMSNYVMTGKQLKEAGIGGTMTLIEEIGRAIRESHRQHTDPIRTVLEVTHGYRVWTGKIADIARRTVGGFARGTAKVEGMGGYVGRTLDVDFQNEFLIARTDDDVLVTVPDLITMLDAETGEPITTEDLRYGFRVVVIGIPCDSRWRTADGLDLVGPRYFGYDVPFVPVEQRFG